MHSCKRARQLAIEAWWDGLVDRYEVQPPRCPYEREIMEDMQVLFGQLWERVTRWQTSVRLANAERLARC